MKACKSTARPGHGRTGQATCEEAPINGGTWSLVHPGNLSGSSLRMDKSDSGFYDVYFLYIFWLVGSWYIVKQPAELKPTWYLLHPKLPIIKHFITSDQFFKWSCLVFLVSELSFLLFGSDRNSVQSKRVLSCLPPRAMLELIEVMERWRQLLAFIEICHTSGCPCLVPTTRSIDFSFTNRKITNLKGNNFWVRE